jgi:spore coat protein U-like protein
MYRFLGVVLAVLLVFTATALPAMSDATSNMSVSATVPVVCTISATTLNFGNYDPFSTHSSTPLDGTATVTVACTTGSSASVTLGQGNHAGGGSSDTAPVRRMADAGAAHYLGYDVYRDSGRNTVWGNTAATGADVTGTGTTADLTVYGRIPGGQSGYVGSYTDSVVATVTF